MQTESVSLRSALKPVIEMTGGILIGFVPVGRIVVWVGIVVRRRIIIIVVVAAAIRIYHTPGAQQQQDYYQQIPHEHILSINMQGTKRSDLKKIAAKVTFLS